MQFKRQAKEGVDVNLTPLIDVVFLLLIFFMVSTTFTDKTEMNIDLPESESAALQMQQPKAINVVVSHDGAYSVNGQRLINTDLATLKSAVSKASGGNQQSPFIITADGKAAHQYVVRAMDAAGQLGFTNLSITTVHPVE